MSRITPEVARELILGDDTNIAEKVAAGQTLSKRERELLESIARTVPAQASPVAAPVAVPTEGLALEVEVAPRMVGGRVKYPQELLHYATVYDSSERTVKRWVAEGRDAEPMDLAPLHAPAEMVKWWERRHPTTRCPAGILTAVGRKAEMPVPTTAATPLPVLPEAAQCAPLPVPPAVDDQIVGLDFPGQVAAMRREQAITKIRLEKARRGVVVEGQTRVDEGAVESLQRQAVLLSESLRKAENDLVTWLKERELLTDAAAVRAENNRIASAIFQSVRRLVRTVRPQLANKSPAEQDRIWEVAVAGCFRSLKESKFTPFSPEEGVV